MAQSLSKILVHAIFSTKERRPLLRDPALRDDLHAFLGGILKQRDCPPQIVGGVDDHVHMLIVLSRISSVAEIIKESKRSSSAWVKTAAANLADFSWQNGYGAFSIGASQLETVRDYILQQDQHHRRLSFQDEFRQLCLRYDVDLDERYVRD